MFFGIIWPLSLPNRTLEFIASIIPLTPFFTSIVFWGGGQRTWRVFTKPQRRGGGTHKDDAQGGGGNPVACQVLNCISCEANHQSPDWCIHEAYELCKRWQMWGGSSPPVGFVKTRTETISDVVCEKSASLSVRVIPFAKLGLWSSQQSPIRTRPFPLPISPGVVCSFLQNAPLPPPRQAEQRCGMYLCAGCQTAAHEHLPNCENLPNKCNIASSSRAQADGAWRIPRLSSDNFLTSCSKMCQESGGKREREGGRENLAFCIFSWNCS